MAYDAGLNVSLELTVVCVVNASGEVVAKKGSIGPEALVAHLDDLGVPVVRVGLEAGPLSQRLHAGLAAAGFDAVLLETRHVKAALSAMTVKTDRRAMQGRRTQWAYIFDTICPARGKGAGLVMPSCDTQAMGEQWLPCQHAGRGWQRSPAPSWSPGSVGSLSHPSQSTAIYGSLTKSYPGRTLPLPLMFGWSGRRPVSSTATTTSPSSLARFQVSMAFMPCGGGR